MNEKNDKSEENKNKINANENASDNDNEITKNIYYAKDLCAN